MIAFAFAILYVMTYMFGMRATTATDLRKNLAAELDKVHNDHEPVIIVRSGGKPAGVLMSLEDFSSWQETEHLLRSPANAERLRKAIRELNAGKGRARELLD